MSQIGATIYCTYVKIGSIESLAGIHTRKDKELAESRAQRTAKVTYGDLEIIVFFEYLPPNADEILKQVPMAAMGMTGGKSPRYIEYPDGTWEEQEA